MSYSELRREQAILSPLIQDRVVYGRNVFIEIGVF